MSYILNLVVWLCWHDEISFYSALNRDVPKNLNNFLARRIFTLSIILWVCLSPYQFDIHFV